jgi:TRAP-type C4-dicarboxylate transport system permease large subunit
VERDARVEIEKARALHGLWMEKFVIGMASSFLGTTSVVATIAAFFAPMVEQRTWGTGVLTAVVFGFLGFFAGSSLASSRNTAKTE